MNSRHFLSIFGLGALTVALLAIPSFSAHKQDPGTASGSQANSDVANGYEQSPLAQVRSQLADLDDQEGDQSLRVLVDTGHGWLGVGVSEVTADKVKQLKLPAERGVVLGKVIADSPAAKAGLKENDVITEINGQHVEGTEQFRRMIREIPAGRSAQVTVWRDGRAQTLSVTIGKSQPNYKTSLVAPGNFAFHMPELPPLDDLMEVGPWFAGQPRLGIDAEDLDGDFGNFFGAPDGQGVLVRGVFADSPAAKAGLKVGDVITTANGERVHSIGELREKLSEKHEAKTVQLGVLRNKAPLTLSLEMPAPTEKHEHHNSVRTNI